MHFSLRLVIDVHEYNKHSIVHTVVVLRVEDRQQDQACGANHREANRKATENLLAGQIVPGQTACVP